MNLPKKFRFSLLLIFAILTANGINAQTFSAAIQAGLVASQIDGDQYAGYNKPGPFIGINGIARLKEKIYLETGLAYVFRGSQSEFIQDNSYPQFKIKLQYIDIPVTFHYKDWLEPEAEFYRMDFYAGGYFGRLLSASAEYSGYDDVTDLFNKNEIGIIIGGAYSFGPHGSVGAKWCRALNYVFEHNTNNVNQNSLLNRFLQFYYQYKF